MVLESLFGSRTRARVLLHLHEAGESWPRRIARETGCDVNAVQAQLARLKAGAVVVSEPRGRRRVYRLNPAYPLAAELRSLLARVAGPAFTESAAPDRYVVVRRLP